MTESETQQTPEFEGATVEEAVETALRELGLSKDQAEVSVLDKGARGFLGLGARPARVRVAAGDLAAAVVREMATRVLGHMGIEAEVAARQDQGSIEVEIRGGESDGLLIGRKGETLAALQHVLTRMASRRLGGQAGTIRLDVAGYRDRRDRQLQELARTLAQRVERTGRRAMTEPLPPAERRAIHRALEDFPGVETHAAGSGLNKRVVLVPTRRRGGAAAS